MGKKDRQAKNESILLLRRGRSVECGGSTPMPLQKIRMIIQLYMDYLAFQITVALTN